VLGGIQGATVYEDEFTVIERGRLKWGVAGLKDRTTSKLRSREGGDLIRSSEESIGVSFRRAGIRCTIP